MPTVKVSRSCKILWLRVRSIPDGFLQLHFKGHIGNLGTKWLDLPLYVVVRRVAR